MADVCKAVELTNPSSVKSRLDDEDTQLLDLHALNRGSEPTVGNSLATFINETAFYDVLLFGTSPKVKPYRKWITHEVLPSIRRHGAYMTEDTIKKALTSPDFLIQLATNLKEEQERSRLLKAQADAQQQQLQLQAPKVLFANAVETSKKSCLIGELAKIIKQNGTEIGQNRLFEWMRINGYLCKYGESRNQPTQKAMELNLFEIKKITITNPDGSVRVTTTTKVTPKGQIYFINRFLGKGIESEMQSVGNNSAQ